MNIHNTDHCFEILGVGGNKESVQHTQRVYKNKNERKEQYSHLLVDCEEKGNDILFLGK